MVALAASLPATIASARPAATSQASSTAAAGEVDPAVAAQVEAIMEEKASRTPAEQKVDSNLLYAVNEAETGVAVDGAPQLQSTVEAPGGTVVVDITGDVTGGLLRTISAVGGRVVAKVPAFDAVRAELPITAVDQLAAQGDVREVRPADEATTNRATGGDDASTASVGLGNNEADVTHGANLARDQYGVDGTGVKVCVLSDGVTTLADRQASGDLPAVDVLAGQTGTGDEGTAMLELIHDIAPGATLGFATAFSGVAQFAQNILDLQASGCEIMVDDVTYYSETTFQDGPIAQAIATVRTAGVTYFTSAGNAGNLPDGTSGTWQGDFNDAGASQSPLALGLRMHGWGQGVPYNTITKTGGPLNLQWADPVGGSSNDYDLYLLNGTGTAITASSTNVQSGTQNPAESISTSPSGSRVLVTKSAAAASRYLVLYTNRGQLTYGTGGSARGHNVSLEAVSVAATPAANANTVSSPTGPYPAKHSAANVSELFSSDGPTRQYFTANGTPITAGNFTSTGGVGRNGVDITAADGATTTTPGFSRFFGTSAAAPNAAAIAALALSAKPTLTPTQIESALGATAIGIEAAGFDPVAGAGIVMAEPLLSNVGAVTKAKLGAGNRSVTPQTGDGDAHLEPGETATITQQLTNTGAATATGVSATLVSNSANATVTQGSVTYSNIAPAATGTPNSLPFRISVPAGCPCGTVLPFTLTVTYAGGVKPTEVISFNIVVGEPAPAVSTAYSGGVVAIPDNSTTGASASVAVATNTTVRGVTVTIGGSSCTTTTGSTTVGIDHSYISDLRLTLTSPTGTTVALMGSTGGGGHNLCQTVFSDAGASSIQDQTAAAAPFTGTFKPKEPLSTFVGENPQGTWTLKAYDGVSTDSGSIRAFSISISGSQCTPPNSAPVANADAYTIGQDQTLDRSAPGVLANDTDANNDALTAVIGSSPAHGNVTLNANGSFSYTPLAGYVGDDAFTYRAKDAALTSASAALVTIHVNGKPTPQDDGYTTSKNTVLDVAAPGVLTNDTDPEGDSLASIKVSNPAHGSVTLNDNGSFSYTPTTGYVGGDSFTYQVVDAYSTSATKTVLLSVNAPPTATNDAYDVAKNTTLNRTAPGVLSNDSDPESDPITTELGTGPTHGTLTLNANGSFAYTPTTGYTGTDSFTYRAKDAYGKSGLATVTLTVTAVNVAPSAAADTYSTPRNTKLTVPAPGVLGNDSDPEASALTATLTTTPASGTVVLNPNGGLEYTPANGFSGTVTFTYKASDGSLLSSAATVTIKVNGPPVGVADSYNVGYETTLNVPAPGVLGNDTDPEGDARTAELGATTSHGTLSLIADGSFSYTPTSGYSGPDSFTYRAKDATGQSSLTTVTLTVATAGNHAPVGVADSLTAVSGVAEVVAAPGVLGNDTDADGNALTAAVVTSPAHGTLVLNANGSYTYTPSSSYVGADSFTYKASDGSLQSSAVTVSITVISKTSAYVAAIYTDFLTRVADAGGMSYWGGRLDRGAETRTSFVLKMSRSHEYGVKVVTRAFQDVLGRSVDPSGREYWANKVQNGMPVSTLTLNLISSNEYLTKSGGTVGGFVDKTYVAILGRAPSSSERSAQVALINGGKTRLKVASELYASTESRQRRVKVQYVDLLKRQPTAGELSAGVTKLATKSDIDLAIELGAGTEYYNASLLR